jgi:hypothetical protein
MGVEYFAHTSEAPRLCPVAPPIEFCQLKARPGSQPCEAIAVIERTTSLLSSSLAVVALVAAMFVGAARCAPRGTTGVGDVPREQAGCAMWTWRYQGQDGTARCAPRPPLNMPIQYLQLITAHTHADDQALAENVGLIWAAAGGFVPGVPSNLYTPAYRADLSIPGWSDTYLNWLYAHHPDWIMYLDDRTTVAWEFGNTKAAPIDISNPAAEAWMLSRILAHAAGAQGVSLDNVGTVNASREAGHYAGAVAPCNPLARPACGGHWVRDYPCESAMVCSRTDPTWTRINLTYLRYLTRGLRQHGLFTWCNIGHDRTPNVVAAGEVCDGVLQEGVPQHMGTTKANLYYKGFIVDYLFASDLYDAEHLARSPYIHASYLDGHDTSEITPREEVWCMAWPLLVEQAPEMSYSFCGFAGSRKVEPYPPSMGGKVAGDGFARLPIGHAVAPPPTVNPYASPPTGVCGLVGLVNAGACARRYSNGWVYINPVCQYDGRACSADPALIAIPAPPRSEAWWSSQCAQVPPGPYRLAPVSALIIAAGPAHRCNWPQP